MTPGEAPGRVDFCPATGKVRHRHRADAAVAVRKWRARLHWLGKRVSEDGRLQVFLCEHCSSYHLGNDHPDRRGRQDGAADATRRHRESIEAVRLAEREGEAC